MRLSAPARPGAGSGLSLIHIFDLTGEDIDDILRFALYEFPIAELGIYLPSWLDALPADAPLKAGIFEGIAEAVQHMSRVRDAFGIMDALGEREDVSAAGVKKVDMGSGKVMAELELPRSLYYDTISEQSGFEIHDDGDLKMCIRDSA